MARRLALGALLVVVLGGCGSSPAKNGLILALKYEREGNALYVMNPDGSRLRKVHSNVGPAAWTPDGKRIAYNTAKPVTDRGVSYTVFDLWLMRPDGTEKHRVAENVPLGTISPDGKTVAFVADSCEQERFSEDCELSVDNPSEIYIVGIDGHGRRRLTRNRSYDGAPSWSPDGKRIVFATDLGPRIMDRDGRNPRPLTKGDWSIDPFWSPRGDRILLMGFDRWALISSEGGRLRYVKRGPRGPQWGATWSPDGRKIAYMAKRARAWTAHDPMQIWVMNADGTGRHPITQTFGWVGPSWAPAP